VLTQRADAITSAVTAATAMASTSLPAAAHAVTAAAAAPPASAVTTAHAHDPVATAAPASAKGSGVAGVGAWETLVSGHGDTLWKLGGGKFASVTTFKSKRMVGLREYYQKDEQWLPGKKGISLGVDQFDTLRERAQVCAWPSRSWFLCLLPWHASVLLR
jgi:hypothetical protein